MKVNSLFKFVFLGVLLVTSFDVDAQRRNNKYKKRRNKAASGFSGSSYGRGRFSPYLYGGVSVNTGNYFGDLAPVDRIGSTKIAFTTLGGGVHLGYKFANSVAARIGFNYVRLKGEDASSDPDPNNPSSLGRYGRNLSFRNDIFEFHIVAQLFIFPNNGGIRNRFPINPYIIAGGSVFYHDPKAQAPSADFQKGGSSFPEANQWVRLKPLGTEGQTLPDSRIKPYSNFAIAIPVGVGAKARIPATPFDVSLELGMRVAFTDYIDDIGANNYVNPTRFKNPLARIMSDRSAEPRSSLTGKQRDLSNLGITNKNPSGLRISSAIRGGATGETQRGGKGNDFMLFTQIKLSYNFTMRSLGGKRR